MMRLDDFMSMERRSSGVLFINIYPVVSYPRKLRISKTSYNESYSPDKWRKRIGDLVYYYGRNVKDNFEEIDVNNPLFGQILRKYLLDMLSENITEPWQLKEPRSTLRIVREISESYRFSDRIKLQYELIIGVHHWQDTNFGLTVDLRINIFDRESGNRLSYPEIKDKYGENVRRSIWYSVQAFHKHLTSDGKKYATAMRDKFNLITSLLKEAFGVSGEEKSFESSDGEVKVIFEPLEVVEVASNDAV